MRIRKLITLGLAGLLPTMLGAANCEEQDTHPNAPRQPNAQHAVPEEHHTQAEPAPHADPFLIDRALVDPNLALLKLFGDPKRQWAITITLRRGHEEKPFNVTAGVWQQVLVVAPGDHIGFLAVAKVKGLGSQGTATVCTIYHVNGKTVGGKHTNIGDFAIVHGDLCAVSYTIP